MEKRTILAILLIFLVFWLSNQFLWKQSEEKKIEKTTERSEYLPLEHETIEDLTGKTHIEPEDIVQAEEVKNNITIENEDLIISFTNKGAVINSIRLKSYFLSNQSEFVELIPQGQTLLGVSIDSVEGRESLKDMIFDFEYFSEEDKYGVEFFVKSKKDGEGAQKVILRRFYIGHSGYKVIMQQRFSRFKEMYGYEVKFDSGIADSEENVSHRNQDYKAVVQVSNSQTSIPLRRLNDVRRIDGSVNWAAVRSKYFIMCIIPNERINTSSINVFERNDSPALDFTVRNYSPRLNLDDSYTLYLGPMIYGNLAEFGVGLENAMEMGARIIQPLSRLFLYVLSNMNRAIPNYGLVIIVFAFLLKVVLSPLTKKSYESSHKMQKVNPYMKEIQKKYKHDPKLMNQELKKLYKEHGVNPLGGCLPLLLQMPIFFALYPVLRHSIEMRQAGFIFWLKDLSEPDPYIILPILMGIFMFVQQKMMMPSVKQNVEVDEKQKAAMQSQKMMMYIMPVFMVFIFRSLPSGLVLYWTIFNVFQIVQQYFIVKKINQ